MSDEEEDLKCQLCGEGFNEENPRDLRVRGTIAHPECLLRNVVGGIGHLVDHSYWCIRKGDPDAWLSYRASAKLVAAHVATNGVPID